MWHEFVTYIKRQEKGHGLSLLVTFSITIESHYAQYHNFIVVQCVVNLSIAILSITMLSIIMLTVSILANTLFYTFVWKSDCYYFSISLWAKNIKKTKKTCLIITGLYYKTSNLLSFLVRYKFGTCEYFARHVLPLCG
jgi:hypothetical protein